LKFEKTILDDHQAQVVVEVGAEELEAARKRAARKLAGRGKVPGFRPGKAPYDVVLRYYGEEAVHEQAMDILVDEVYPEMLKEAEVEPAAAGLLEKVDDSQPPKLTFKVPLKPEVVLGDYHALRVPYEFQEPGADRLDRALEDLRQMYATTETVDREVQPGDYVVVDLKSETKSLERSDFSTIVRSEDQPEAFPFPGFSSELVGMKATETRSLKHTFPGEIKDADLAGKDVALEATVKAVRSVSLPALDDGFAKTVGKYASLEALKEELSKDILTRDRADYDDEYYTRIVDELRKTAVVKYAPQTLEHEAEHVVEDMRSRLAQQGLDLETYYKMRNTDADKFMEEEAKPMAQKRLERSLILDEVARQEKIEVDNESLDQEFNTTLVDLQSQGVNLAAVRGGRQGQQRVAEALAMQSANRLLTRRTLERLRGIATGEADKAAEAADLQPDAPEEKTSAAASTEPDDKTSAEAGS
jgi:trigger factor